MRLGLGISIPGTSGLVQAAFSPLDLSPVLWLDASDTSTITESGGAVSQWDDKSGNGNDVVQATAAQQPTTGTRTLNGLNVLDFDGSNAIAGTSLYSLTSATYFVVSEYDTIGTIPYFIDGTGASNRNIVGAGFASAWRLFAGTVVDAGTADTDPHVLRAVYSSTDTLHVDGVVVISGNAGSQSATGITLGSNSTQSASYLDGIIAEVIVVDGTLTAGEISDTESYLANKWGITI